MDLLYCIKLTTLVPLRQKIENACAAIPLETLANIAQVEVPCTNKCLKTKGHHFEHFL